MFTGRARELSDINRRYQNGRFECAIIYGRRRVGKTTLINQFVQDKECILFTATETNEKQNLADLSRSVYAMSEEYGESEAQFPSFQHAFETIFRIAKNRRLVFVIDEYPYLAECSKGIASILQKLIDANKDSSKLFLILCGSSMSFMEHQVLGYQSPLYGRRTCQYKLHPFDIFETSEYFKGLKGEKLALLYGITGGIPLYVSMMDESGSVEENIKTNFLTANAYLFEEPTNLIKQECRDASQYNAVIGAIAKGASKFSEICSKAGLESALATNYLNRLISLGIIKKELPFGEETGRKTIYRIQDSMFSFWYRFVQGNISAINRGLTDTVYAKITPQLPDFMGRVFEEICMQYLWKLLGEGKTEIAFTGMGRWWGNDPRKKEQTELDILAFSDDGGALFGECKWTNENVDVKVLDTLIDRSQLFHESKKQYYVFAKTGFTQGCRQKAQEMGCVKLVTLDEMI